MNVPTAPDDRLHERLARPGRWSAQEALAILRAAADDARLLHAPAHVDVVGWLRRDVDAAVGGDPPGGTSTGGTGPSSTARADALYATVRAGGPGERRFRAGADGARHAGYGDLLETVDGRTLARFLGLGCPWGPGLPPGGSVVVDLGCGAGLDATIAARAAGPTGAVHALDVRDDLFPPDPRPDGTADRPRFRVAPADATGLPAGTVDLVIANGLPPLLGLAGAPEVAAEVRRILRPGGTLRSIALVADDPGDDAALVAARCTGKPLLHELVAAYAAGGLRVADVVPRPSPYAPAEDPGPVRAVLLIAGPA